MKTTYLKPLNLKILTVVFTLLMATKNLKNHFFYALWPYVTSQKKG